MFNAAVPDTARVPTPRGQFWKVLEFLLENLQDLESFGK